jgi:ABC-type amino acid transport substrate-binding protein
VNVVVLARKDAEIEIEQPMDIANYRIGVIRDDIGEQMLLSHGVPRAAMQEAEYVTVLVEQLRKKRIDLLVYSERSTFWWSKKANIDPNLFESVYLLEDSEVYFAFNVDTPSVYIKKLQKGVDMLKEKGSGGKSRYEQILDKY